MKGKKLVLVGLALIVALAGVSIVAACGGSSTTTVDPKIALRDALDVIEADISQLTTLMTSGGGTVAELKTAKDTIAPHWAAVVTAAKNVKGADSTKAQQLWDAVSAAIDSVPANADLATLAAAVLGPVTALTDYEKELRTLAGPSSTTTS